MIRFARELSTIEREEISNGLRNFFKDDQTVLLDVPGLVESTSSTLFFIDLFYVCVAIISIILTFFLILVSFISNIKENSWEFGVLRAVGLNKSQITRVYMYEAFVLTFSSGLIGTVIGIIVAITLTLQFLMFTELPFKFIFPTNMFLTTFVLGLFTSIGGSYFAIKDFRE
jgi:ABC-type antimicrobial peptide transport system permease subunit